MMCPSDSTAFFHLQPVNATANTAGYHVIFFQPVAVPYRHNPGKLSADSGLPSPGLLSDWAQQ